MRRTLWLALILAVSVGAPTRAAEPPKAIGTGPAYVMLGKLPVLHDGRRKPLDTLAREEVKQIYGRESITFFNAQNEPVARWSPVAALFDWSVRPEFWNDQPIIEVVYLPLRRLLLADAIEARLSAIAAGDNLTAENRAELTKLVADKELTADKLSRFQARAKLSDADAKGLSELAGDLSEGRKWLSPRLLESAMIAQDGQKLSFDVWARDLMGRRGQAEANVAGANPLNEAERRAIEAWTRLLHYQAYRDRDSGILVEPFLVLPRPNNAQALAFAIKAVEKIRQSKSDDGLTLLEQDALKELQSFLKKIPREDQNDLGADPKFDKQFTDYLRDKSAWVSLRLVLDSPPAELTAAGYPAEAVAAFRAAFTGLEKAEADAPGHVDEAKTAAFVGDARALGTELNGKGEFRYPTSTEIGRETFFNAFAPFYKAPWFYGLALALFPLCIGLSDARNKALVGLRRVLYVTGLGLFVAGIGLEISGFYFRYQISTWGLVTNMYETVIWVALVTAVLGLVFELIYRRTYVVLAASGVALLATILAANVPLLDPHIKGIQPVLRDRFWLATHVTMEVGSYGAFALAMGLGLIGVFYYLTATYRRSPRWRELASPLAPGLPLLAVGTLGLVASYGGLGPNWNLGVAGFYLVAALAGVGGFLSIVGLGSLLGEGVNRLTFQDVAAGTAWEQDSAELPAATTVQTVTVGESGGAVATLSKPTVAEMKARAARNRPRLDARGQAMQATAVQVKSLSNWIYRTMQVGVLLIAGGTFLGGVWADYSWGRFWGWDPKEVWALITLLVYLIPLHGRFAGWVNTFGLTMAAVVCFGSVMMAWYGVNFVLGVGLHSYGFVEGGSQGIVGAVVLGVLAVAGAAAWRRGLASRTPTVA